MTYIVELEEGCWLAPWRGDPGRTTVEARAKTFPTRRSAVGALGQARRHREYREARIINKNSISWGPDSSLEFSESIRGDCIDW